MKLLNIRTDGGARGNPGPAGIGVVILDENFQVIAEYKEFIGHATNNVAEYKALLLALKEAGRLEVQELVIYMDSELVVRQMQGRYKIKEPALQDLAGQVLVQIKKFHKVEFKHVPREQNKEADRLVNQAIDEQKLLDLQGN